MLGVGLGQIAWGTLNAPLLAYVSGIAASFCLFCAGAVWSMREKADAALSGELLDSTGFRKERHAAGAIRRRSTWRAVVAACAALAAVSPAVSFQLAGPVWHWMVLLCGAGVAEAAYSFLIVNAWEDQLREHRDRQIERIKEAEEALALRERIGAAPGGAPEGDLSVWSTVGGTLTKSDRPH